MQFRFEHTTVDDLAQNLAQPVSMVANGQDITGQPVVLIKAVGGLTKLEQAAISIFAGMQAAWRHDVTASCDDAGDETVCERCVNWAEALLSECAKRQAPKEQPAGIEVAG